MLTNNPTSIPNNPTGAVTPFPFLHAVIELSQTNNIYILSDEVYSPLDPEHSPSIISLKYPMPPPLAQCLKPSCSPIKDLLKRNM